MDRIPPGRRRKVRQRILSTRRRILTIDRQASLVLALLRDIDCDPRAIAAAEVIVDQCAVLADALHQLELTELRHLLEQKRAELGIDDRLPARCS